MNYQLLLDTTTELAYQLAMCGAETFRIEESISRIFSAYGLDSETFAIPNCLTVSIKTPEGESLTRMRRIGYHGNDLDSVERYSNLGRKICAQKPDPETAKKWLQETTDSRASYSMIAYYIGNFLSGFGFCIIFGGSLWDAVLSGICGLLVGLINRLMNGLRVNAFFSTIASGFIMALTAYVMGIIGLTNNTDAVIIGALMLLVPGLIFTNAMRDIIFGDTNSGINRIVQVFMIAAAIALGTGTAWNLSQNIWGIPQSIAPLNHPFWWQCIAAFIACVGFSILFNIHGPGVLLCALGGLLAWAGYLVVYRISGSETTSCFFSAVIAACYAEIMARVRKYPAISYLVLSIFPLIPGAGIYYATNYLVLDNAASFASKGMQTVAVAGAIAVGILLVSTLVRLSGVWKEKKYTK